MAHGRSWPGDVQLEYCDICGVRLPAAERVQATTQNLAGRWACPKCAPLVLNPSYMDFGGPGNMAPTPGAIEPHSGVDWITDIQGTETYSSFYAGALPSSVPTADLAISSATQTVRAVPFTMPRMTTSHRIETIQLTSSGYASAVKVAIYSNGKNAETPGDLLTDLGTVTMTNGAASTIPVGLTVSGDSIYFVLLYGTAPGTITAIGSTEGSDIIAAGVTSLGSGRTPFPGAWPQHLRKVPWTKLSTNFYAVKVNLDS